VASIAGINPTAISAVSWMLGCGLAGFAGVLLSPIQGLSEIQFTLLLVVSFAAVVVGRMRSLPLAFAGAIGIGLIQGIAEKFITIDSTALGGVLNTGFRPSVPFIIMLVFLLAYQGLRREQFEVDLRAGPTDAEVAPTTRLRGWRAAVGPLAVAVGLFSVPLWPGINSFWLNVVSQGLALSVLFLTFTVLTGEGGMLSLAQITLAGLGAFTAAKLATNSGWPVWAALLVGGLVCIPIGLIVAGMSLRLGGLYLALATLAFSQLVKYLVFARNDFDNLSSGVDISRPKLFGINFEGFGSTNFYLLLATVFCVIALLVINLRRSSTGLVLTAMRSSEAAAATIGISVVRSKLIVFGVSSFIAGLGGGLFAVTIGSATVNTFEVLIGIVWLAIVVTWGIRSVLGALMAGILFAVVPYKLSFILVIIVVFIVFGLGARLIGSKAIYTPRGALLAAAVLAAGIAAIVGLTSLVVEAGQQGAGLISFEGGKVLLSPALFAQGPTLLFGLGAVFLAKQPRGVLFDLMNRIRLRQLQREARLAETQLAPATSGFGA
jgi:branched-chain amino acid transport system permease protein